MSRPRVLIEQWLPIDQIGAECMRERGASSALPPLYFLHVWWARRPLTVSRAAILASLLPAYPTGEDSYVRPWSEKFLKRFPTFDSYKEWFLKLIGIQGNPAASRKIIDWAKTQGVKLTPKIMGQIPNEWKEGLPNDMGVSIPYGYPRAFTYNPSEEQLGTLYELLEWTWGTRDITFCDPMAGGGSIPFEALRFGLTVHANELNPVASVILKATLDYPARFGPSLADDIRKYGKIWCDKVRERLQPFYPIACKDENIFAYLWARTVACPTTGKPVPLSPNWWLKKPKDSPEESWIGVKLLASPSLAQVSFQIVNGKSAKTTSGKGTVKGGSGVSPWTNDPIEGDYIKAEARAGRMGHQLYAVGVKKNGENGELTFRLPTKDDEQAIARAEAETGKQKATWEALSLIPIEEIGSPSNYDRGHRLYGIRTWQGFFSNRQLLAFAVALDGLRMTFESIRQAVPDESRCAAIETVLAIAFDKALDYNCIQTIWHASRTVVAHKFNKHNYTFQWSYVEFDAARNLFPWAVEQAIDAFSGIAGLCGELPNKSLLFSSGRAPVDRLRLTCGPAQNVRGVPDRSVRHVCVDPPYYDNVQYAECSDFFLVWMSRTIGHVHPSILTEALLSPKDEEAVANPARFADTKGKKKQLAERDYEIKMMACFREIGRMLTDDGVLAVMFTHKKIEAWDTRASAH